MALPAARIDGRLALMKILALSAFVSITLAACYSPDPVFPPPNLGVKDPVWSDTLSQIQRRLESGSGSRSPVDLKNASYAVELTSSTGHLGSFHQLGQHARTKGVKVVDENSFFRMASVSKVLTVFALLHQQEAGGLNLDGPITKYIPELTEQTSYSEGFDRPQWSQISLRSLASQLSGIYRDSPRSS